MLSTYNMMETVFEIKTLCLLSRCVDPEFSTVAGMLGAASIMSGICAGIGFSYLMPRVVSHPSINFENPEWWPTYINSYQGG